MARTKVEIGGKTYKVYTIDVGGGPKDYVDVMVATPGGVIVSYVWRPVPRDGPTWNRVMAAVKKEEK